MITTKKISLLSMLVMISACAPLPENLSAEQAQPSPNPAVPAALYTRAAVQSISARIPVPTAEKSKALQNTENYQVNISNPVYAVQQNPVSTFSVDVDTGSYSNVRRYLARQGELPPVDAVRIEEFLNYFDYPYFQTQNSLPFALQTQVINSPWQTDAKLIKIAIQAKDHQLKTLPAANLVFLVDVSGSMDAEDKLPLVKKTLRLLTEQLRPEDKVSIISYASGEKLLLEPTSGREKDKILKVINGLNAAGATAGEQAIQLAYATAERHYLKSGINRIFLATDGDFNVGITNFESLKGLVAEKRKSGVSLTTLGFGTGNYNERLMEQLADAGDGNYSYIDSEKEAKKVLQRQLSSTLATVAQDVKVQVEFNPATVKEYRLVGYENRLLNAEDFNNDQVDAGDIGAGHRVTALYEIIPAGKQGWLEPSRYQKQNLAKASNNAEYAFIKLRYKLPQARESQLISHEIKAQSLPLAAADLDSQWAVAVANFAQLLQGGKYSAKMGWAETIQLAERARGADPYGLRQEMIELLKIAQSLSTKRAEKQE